MVFLLIGDIFGKSGRICLKKHLTHLVKENNVDFIIANGENISHGISITKKHYNFLKEQGVDVITSGNHIFHKSDPLNYINNTKDLLKPLNLNPYTPGNGTILVKKNNKKVRVTNIIGQVFMNFSDNPYYHFDKLLKKDNSDIHIVDMHAEATAEKMAFALNYDGKISCLFGTHTHIQTADNRILPKGTAFISDIGMVGPYDSVIGVKIEEAIHFQKTGLKLNGGFKPSDNNSKFCGALLETDDKTNKVLSFKRIRIVPNK